MTIFDPNSPLSPGEAILLQCDKFVPKAKWMSNGLLHMDLGDAAELAKTILTTAFLVSEQTGTLKLETHQKKARLGLGQVQILFAEPVGTVRWPAHSPEADLCAIAFQLKSNGNFNEVDNIVYAWLKCESLYPAMAVVEATKSGLAERGLLKIIEKQVKMFLFRKVNAHGYVLTPTTIALATQQPIAAIQKLLVDTERDRPDVWKFLVNGITEALRKRVKD
jgi:hypothetical protein